MVSHHSTPGCAKTAPPEKPRHGNHQQEEQKWENPHPPHTSTRSTPCPGIHGRPLILEYVHLSSAFRLVHMNRQKSDRLTNFGLFPEESEQGLTFPRLLHQS